MFNVSIISLSIFNVNRLIAFPYGIAKMLRKTPVCAGIRGISVLWLTVVRPVTWPCFMFDFSSESL